MTSSLDKPPKIKFHSREELLKIYGTKDSAKPCTGSNRIFFLRGTHEPRRMTHKQKLHWDSLSENRRHRNGFEGIHKRLLFLQCITGHL